MNNTKFEIATHIGNRKSNQDVLMVNGKVPYEEIPASLYAIEEKTEGIYPFGVFDGMGGELKGDEVAYMVASHIQNAFSEQKFDDISQAKDFLMEKLDEAHKLVSKKFWNNAGTTATVCIVDGNEYFLINIGDSPAFLVSEDKIEELTRRQNLAWYRKERGEPFSKWDESTLLHCVGIGSYLPSDVAHIHHGQLNDGDMLIICTDGITNHYDDNELREAIDKLTLKEITDNAILEVNADNCTVIAYKHQVKKTEVQNE